MQICQRRREVLRFLLRGSVEVGFVDKVQLGTTYLGPAAGVSRRPPGTENATVHATTRQSDEGGRFDRCVTEYRIVEVAERDLVEEDDLACWVSLGQIYEMLKVPGLVTNEARSALALLLTYL